MDHEGGPSRLTMHFEDLGSHLLAVAAGPWEELPIKQKIVAMRHEADATGNTRILLDMRRVTAPASQASRFFVGVYAAEIWRPPLRVAAVLAPDVIDGLTENAAVNRGADVKAFTSIDHARRWLLEGAADGAASDSGDTTS